MAMNTLNDKTIRALKGGERTSKHFDGGGLYLEVTPTGSKLWRLKYRFGGKEKRLALGAYPLVALQDARARRDDARKQLTQGIDPGAARKALKTSLLAVDANSFEVVAREWHAQVHAHAVSEDHAARTLRRLEADIFPVLGARPIAAIEAPDLLAALRKIEARGAIETAHRAKDSCGQVFRYGIATGRCLRNPAADLRDALRPVVARHHAAIVDPKAGGALLRDLMQYAGQPVTRCALALSAMLLLRPGELRQLEWSWVDLDNATVTIPPALMKRRKVEKMNGDPHVVPLAAQALKVFEELHPLTGHKRYVFPSLHTGDRPMSENTVNVALRRMGYDRETMTAHGFRAMARIMIEERLGLAPAVIEAQLAHTVSDALGRAYNRTTFLAQRRDMMQRWADYLDKLREGAQVLPFKAA
jgi:integrase